MTKRIATEGEMKKYRKVFKLKYDQNGYLVAYQRNSRYIKEEIRNLGFFFIIEYSTHSEPHRPALRATHSII